MAEVKNEAQTRGDAIAEAIAAGKAAFTEAQTAQAQAEATDAGTSQPESAGQPSDAPSDGAPDATGRTQGAKGKEKGSAEAVEDGGREEAPGDAADTAEAADAATDEPSDDAAEGDAAADDKPGDGKEIERRFAQLRRQERAQTRREEAFDLREQSLNARERELLGHAEKYGQMFSQIDSGMSGALKAYCQVKGLDFNDQLARLNYEILGVAKPTEAGVKHGTDGQLRQELDELKTLIRSQHETQGLSRQLRRAFNQRKDSYPESSKQDPYELDDAAVAVHSELTRSLNRAPTTEEVFDRIEERLEYEAFRASRKKSAGGSASAKTNPAAPNGASARGNGAAKAANPASAEAESVEHGDGAGEANTRRGNPASISDRDASVRSGAKRRYESDDDAKRAAIEDALRYAKNAS